MKSDDYRKTGSDGKIDSAEMTTHAFAMIETTLLSITKGKGENKGTKGTTNVVMRIS